LRERVGPEEAEATTAELVEAENYRRLVSDGKKRTKEEDVRRET
jgi:hypothetical protein